MLERGRLKLQGCRRPTRGGAYVDRPFDRAREPLQQVQTEATSLDASAHADAVVLDQQVIVIVFAHERDEDETLIAGQGTHT